MSPSHLWGDMWIALSGPLSAPEVDLSQPWPPKTRRSCEEPPPKLLYSLVTGPGRTLSLKLSDTESMSLKYEPTSAARFINHGCGALPNLRTEGFHACAAWLDNPKLDKATPQRV